MFNKCSFTLFCLGPVKQTKKSFSDFVMKIQFPSPPVQFFDLFRCDTQEFNPFSYHLHVRQKYISTLCQFARATITK